MLGDLYHYFAAAVGGDYGSDYLWHFPVWAQPFVLHGGKLVAGLFH